MKLFLYLLTMLSFMACTNKNEHALSGFWQLQIIEAKDSTGQWQEADWMKHGSGLLHYDNAHHMSVHFWPDTSVIPNQEPYWYVAEYATKLDTVFHKRLMHSIPAENHKTAKRLFKVNQDTLYLTAPDYGFRLTWVRTRGQERGQKKQTKTKP